MTVTFDVPGVPAPKGSARAIKIAGRAVLVRGSSNVNLAAQKVWADSVGWCAKAACREPIVGPVAVSCLFRFARPQRHTRAQRAIFEHTQKPDGDKLLRCTLDAMTGIAYVDDAQCNDLRAVKRWCAAGEVPGATITVQAIGDRP